MLLLKRFQTQGRLSDHQGLSAEQIPILIARNRAGAHIDAVLPDRSEAAVRPVLEGKLSKDDTLLCMDGDKALIVFAEAEGSARGAFNQFSNVAAGENSSRSSLSP